jgi:hypothetical protein
MEKLDKVFYYEKFINEKLGPKKTASERVTETVTKKHSKYSEKIVKK